MPQYEQDMESLLIPIILFAIGAILIALELFLPGGVLGVFGALAIVAGVVLCFFYSVNAGAVAMVGLLVLGPLAGWLWVGNAHRLPGARSLFLTGIADSRPATLVEPLRMGQLGIATSELRPGGTCEFDGQRISAHSEEGIIPAGSTVRVVAFEDGRATVRPA